MSLNTSPASLDCACFRHIRRLRRIRPARAPLQTASTIVAFIVHSKLDYCNALFLNTESTQLKRLATYPELSGQSCYCRLPERKGEGVSTGEEWGGHLNSP